MSKETPAHCFRFSMQESKSNQIGQERLAKIPQHWGGDIPVVNPRLLTWLRFKCTFYSWSHRWWHNICAILDEYVRAVLDVSCLSRTLVGVIPKLRQILFTKKDRLRHNPSSFHIREMMRDWSNEVTSNISSNWWFGKGEGKCEGKNLVESWFYHLACITRWENFACEQFVEFCIPSSCLFSTLENRITEVMLVRGHCGVHCINWWNNQSMPIYRNAISCD